MRGSFTARTTLSLAAWDAGGELEAEMLVKFTVTPGCAQTWEQPGESPSVEDVAIRLFTAKTKTELPCPAWLHDMFADDDEFRGWLLSEAADQDESAREEAADRRHEEWREERA